ncbi:MAG: YggS family pyridoxal phosphate-dependent enzyme [Deltaproteobacteria bacterium]|nr:YggS family pyridoxal phosphate-dependent enzyme [Deltaproteobacteria bacterium]
MKRACDRVGRDPNEVTLVGVSKAHPVETLEAGWRAGIRVFGENRIQEAEAKVERLPKDAEWHLIGPLQSNKVRRAVHLFSWIHSIDRMKIARAVGREAAATGRSLHCFLEVNLGAEGSKHGFSEASLLAEAENLAALESLQFVGLMAIPPRSPASQGPVAGSVAANASPRYWFQRLRKLRDQLAQMGTLRSFRGGLSMGMSGDFEVAIEEGATHIRVGTALFGQRKRPQP